MCLQRIKMSEGSESVRLAAPAGRILEEDNDFFQLCENSLHIDIILSKFHRTSYNVARQTSPSIILIETFKMHRNEVTVQKHMKFTKSSLMIFGGQFGFTFGRLGKDP